MTNRSDETLMGSREVKVGLMLALIFAAGVFSGVLLNRKLTASEAASATRGRLGNALLAGRDRLVLAEMTDKMKLTPEQQVRVGTILSVWSGKVRQNQQQSLKERLALFDQMMPSIRTNLTSEQVPVYEDMVDRARRRQRQMQNRVN
jgi:hypothetical protein